MGGVRLGLTAPCNAFESKFRRCRPMRENEFRDRLHNALGQPPDLAPPRLGPPDAAERRAYPRAMAAIAIVLAVLLVAVLVASRVALRPQGINVQTAKPSPVAELAPDSFPCALAVVMVSEASGRGQTTVMTKTAGFLNIPSGEFRVDPNAKVSD